MNKKILLQAGLAAALVLTLSLPVLAQETGATTGDNVNGGTNVNAPVLTWQQIKAERQAARQKAIDDAKAAIAAAKLKRQQEIAANLAAFGQCAAAAVDKRDAAVAAALDTRYNAHKAALTARTAALKAGWVLTDLKSIRAALKTAWQTYNQAVKDANSAFRTARQAAWKQFAADVRACQPSTAPGAVDAASSPGNDAAL